MEISKELQKSIRYAVKGAIQYALMQDHSFTPSQGASRCVLLESELFTHVEFIPFSKFTNCFARVFGIEAVYQVRLNKGGWEPGKMWVEITYKDAQLLNAPVNHLELAKSLSNYLIRQP